MKYDTLHHYDIRNKSELMTSHCQLVHTHCLDRSKVYFYQLVENWHVLDWWKCH